MPTSENIALIEKAVAGDLAASKILLYENHKRLLAYIKPKFPKELNGAAEPKDILQDVWLRALSGIGRFKGKTSAQLFEWLKAIARNLIADQVRHLQLKNREGHRILTDNELNDSTIITLLEQMAVFEKTPSKSAASHELMVVLSSAISQLPGDQADAIRLRYLAGLDLGEVAQQLDRSSGAVAMLCVRALKSLRDEMLSKSNYI
jgi:RNA polymerase sigma-70 factor (ECF subfamily)